MHQFRYRIARIDHSSPRAVTLGQTLGQRIRRLSPVIGLRVTIFIVAEVTAHAHTPDWSAVCSDHSCASTTRSQRGAEREIRT